AEVRISVLPLVDSSGNSSVTELSEGMTKELRDRLARAPELLLTNPVSALTQLGIQDLKQVAQTLRVRYLLKGTVRAKDGRIQVRAEIVEPLQGLTLWSGSFDRKALDRADLQDEVAHAVVTALQVKLPESSRIAKEKQRVRNPELYASYLQAKSIGDRA